MTTVDLQSPLLSVVIPTHAPNTERLQRTLDGLRKQSLPRGDWELILVDNATPDSCAVARFDLSWHPSGIRVREDRLGLTWARIAGIERARGKFIVFVDDDNVLNEDYLAVAIDVCRAHPRLGATGGRLIPEFECDPPPWVRECDSLLALRDLGDTPLSTEGEERLGNRYPSFAPVGAGMVLRREAVLRYTARIRSGTGPVVLDRCGEQRGSSGDCDIVFDLLQDGWHVGYTPRLLLTHLIPNNRTTKQYLARVGHETALSWIALLRARNACPWQPIPAWTVPIRKWRAYVKGAAWLGCLHYVRWRQSCGTFEALALPE